MAAIIAKHFDRIQVRHQLPGRLRLHIPLLEDLPLRWHRYQSDLIEIIKLKEGVVDIRLSTMTGSVVIIYDPHQTNPSQIMQWFKSLSMMFYRAFTRAPFVSTQQIAPFLKKMRSQCQQIYQRHDSVWEVT